ncbi:septal ring lytic transglycosylase RlpA family protein [Halomonas mongoliensis]|uniref:Endolytic peptidoglycan transglycosylase RlpA n=1 Tax=Halomonas mongoliensis TaxID=321265 RepID=A0ABU1GJW1_9GAMM|nr:septal ring lytic transglycosylase RlpA family protein [Halomonas mongoliensis]MDR5891876.1 septal ring lytic transglycosylase RlpA family protein [Halomonas mongoliensis]
MTTRLWSLGLVLLLAGCAGGGGQAPSTPAEGGSQAAASPSSSGGRYAMSGDAYPVAPPDVSRVPDAVPRLEPLSRGGNRSTYEVWGKTYSVLPDARGYARQGTASWYGEKFHGYATSNGEIYDMYKMTAAHRSLPLPSFVRVTSLENGRSVIVRVNDRGPFHNDREIDLSYAAAARLDILDRGTGRVKVEAIDVEQWLAENGGAEGRARNGAAPVAPPARQAAGQVAAAPASPAAASPADGRPADGRPADGRPADGSPADGRPAERRPIYLQIAALGSAESARALQSRLEAELSRPVRVAASAGTHRVQVGPLASADQVEPLRGELRRAGFEQSFIVNGAD